ncbi:MAG: APC family permease [Acidobacteriia bacterium]|nr:APC family permease [Terriglobia bacterium]
MSEHKLLRILGAGFGVAVIIGAVIGVGILRTPGEVAAHLADKRLILAMWLGGGLYALLAAASVTELGTMLPESGGYFVFSRRAFGDAVGFTIGWTDWIGQSSAIAYASIAFGEFLGALVPSLAGRETIIGIAIIVIFAALQWSGIRSSSRVQEATSLIKAIAFLALVAACFWFGGEHRAAPMPVRTEPLFVAMILAVQSIILTYDGWYEALYFTEEIRDPVRQLPRSMIGGVALVIVIYVLVNAALVYVLPLGVLAGSKLPAADAALQLFGSLGGTLVTALSLISLPPMISAVMLAASRIPYAMSRAGLFPQSMASVSVRGNPDVSLAMTVVLAMALVASGTFKTLIATASVIFVVNHCFALLALFVLRRREPALPRPFQAWGYPWISALVLITAVGILAGSLFSDPRHSLYAAALIAASFPVYRTLGRRRRETPG